MRHASARGFALLIVLWSMALLGLLGTRITSAAHTGAVEAEAVAGRATLEAEADAALADAEFHLLRGEHPAAAGPVEMEVENEAGRININTAPTGLLAALLLAVGCPADQASTLGAAIADWRTPTTLAQPDGAKLPAYRAAGLEYGPRDAPFRSIDELGLVLGMTPAILARLAPHVTIFTEGDVDRNFADDIVREALVRDGGNVIPAGLLIPETSSVLLLTARARGPDGARFVREATIRISRANDRNDPLLTTLDRR